MQPNVENSDALLTMKISLLNSAALLLRLAEYNLKVERPSEKLDNNKEVHVSLK